MNSLESLLDEVTAIPHAVTPPRVSYEGKMWSEGKIISLIHQGPEGETPLGLFQELLHSRGRRLCVIPADLQGSAVTCQATEYVRGDYWLHSQVSQPLQDSPEEEATIVARFKELMQWYT